MADRKKAFHEQVAEKLIEQLRSGTAPWQRPWQPGEPNAFLPMNPTTGKRYKGINTIHLLSQGRTDPRWLTYNQAQAVDAQVRKGEKGTPVQYWKFTEEAIRRDQNGKPVLDANGEPLKDTVALERPRVFFATAFNADQIEGLAPIERKPQIWDAIARAEALLQASGVVIRHGEHNRAFYRPATDSIHLPDKGQFPSADRYYAPALHELGHATGAPSRLDRDLAHPFGSEGYAREELRVEIASMILGDELGLGHDPEQHAAYVGSWIKALQDDPLEVFRAAAAAEKIHDYVLAFEQQQVQQQTPTADQAEELSTRLNDADRQRRLEEAEREPMAEARQAAAEHTELERVYLTVPYPEKDEAKSLGARWDRQRRSWYLPPGVDPAPFAQWAPASATAPAEGQEATPERRYLAVPYGEREAAKVAGALWDKGARSWYAGPMADLEKLKRWWPENVPSQQTPAMNPRDEFAEALRSLGGIVTGEHPILDGKPHRFSVEGDKPGEHAGFYVGHLDGHPAGYLKNHRTGIAMTWKSKGYALDPAMKARLQAEAGAKLAARAAEQARRHEAAAERVRHQMAKLVPVVALTPYLRAKGIAAHPGVLTDEAGQNTYVPAFDADGKPWTLQAIQADGTKRFAKDSRKDGCFHPLGGFEALAAAPVLVIAEGYATAATLAEALGQATVAAFDSGNLPSVARALHEKHPAKPILIAGDDDRHLKATQDINPGRVKAKAAAQAVGGRALFPIFAPGEQRADPKAFTDFNDLGHQERLRPGRRRAPGEGGGEEGAPGSRGAPADEAPRASQAATTGPDRLTATDRKRPGLPGL